MVRCESFTKRLPTVWDSCIRLTSVQILWEDLVRVSMGYPVRWDEDVAASERWPMLERAWGLEIWSTIIIVENWGQQERQNFTWAMKAGDLGERNRKSRKEHGGRQSRSSGPPCDWHGSFGLALCVCSLPYTDKFLTAWSNLSELTLFGG